MQIIKKVMSLTLVVVMLLGLLPGTVYATESEKLTLEELRSQNGAITVEAYNIGQGFLIEPSLYPKEANQAVAAITVELLESKNIEYKATQSDTGEFSYIGSFKFDDTITADYPSYIDTSTWELSDTTSDPDGYLSEMDFCSYSGWVYTVNHWFASHGADKSFPGQEVIDYNTQETILLGDVIRWHFTVVGFGADCGIPGNAMADMMGGNLFTQADKTNLIFTLAAINDYYGNLESDNVYETALAVATDPFATAEAITAQETILKSYIEETFFTEPEPEAPRVPKDVSTVLNATMEKMAETVKAPVFGTNGGEWTVLGLARGGHFTKDHPYFTDYYNRIVETVNKEAASVNKGGALSNKSTENSRLIMALSAIGKDASSVGEWNLIAPYENFDWIENQGVNGTSWALIALDSNNYTTTDTTIRQKCVNAILSEQHNDGGWSLIPTATLTSNVDVTGMVLTALYPYRSQPEVAAACEKAIAWMSTVQLATGGFPYGNGETSESCAWAIVALTTWGINPDTDTRFIKDGNSAIDNLLSYYIEEESMFAHQGTIADNMGTDQACYALVAYDRFINNENALFDYSDVTFDAATPGSGSEGGSEEGSDDESDPSQMNATLYLPEKVENAADTEFNAIISIDKWDNEAGYKLVDFLMTIPDGLSVTNVAAGERLNGGSINYNLKAENTLDAEGNTITSNKLRCVYFDANENKTLTISGEEFPAEVFTVSFKIDKAITAESLKIAIGGMSVKLNSDSSEDSGSMIIVNTKPVTNPEGGTTGGGSGDVGVVTGVSYSAVELYMGDDVDLIPATKKAVAVAVTGIDRFSTLVYNDGTNNIQFQYSDQITSKTNIPTFVALVDSEINTENFINKDYFTDNGEDIDQSNIAFGNANGDDVINAQDALAVVDAWLRKGDAPTDNQILRMNVNGDSRINTFDALGIVEAFVNDSTYGVVTKAATLASAQ